MVQRTFNVELETLNYLLPKVLGFMHKFLVVFLLIGGLISPSRAQVNVDSLKSEWNNEAQNDSLRLEAVHQLAFDVYRFRNKDSAQYYAQKHLEFARAANLKYHIALALNTLGALNRNDLKTALKFYSESLQIREEIGDIRGVGGTLNNIGGTYVLAGLKSKGINYYQRALHKYDEIGELKFKATCLSNIGAIYHEQKDFEQAIKYLQESLSIFKAIGADNEVSSMSVVSQLSVVYVDNEQYDLALPLSEKCLQFGVENQINEFVMKSQLEIGVIYLKQKRLLEANKKLNELLIEFEESENKNGLEIVNLIIGLLNIEEKKYDDAISRCQRAHLFALEINNVKFEKQACECLYNGYKAKGNGIEALQYFERIQIITDSLNNNDIDKRLQEMEFEKQLYKDSVALAEEERVKQLNIEKIAATKTRKNRIQYSLVVIVVLLLATIIAVATKFSIGPKLASGLIFIFFILTFEFLLVVLDPWVDSVSNGEVGWKIGINTAIALVLFGIHQVSEKKLKNAILKADR